MNAPYEVQARKAQLLRERINQDEDLIEDAGVKLNDKMFSLIYNLYAQLMPEFRYEDITEREFNLLKTALLQEIMEPPAM